MEYLLAILSAIALLLVVLVLLSVLDFALQRITRVELIVMAEQNSHRGEPIFRQLTEDPMAVQIHLRLGAQFTVVVIAILVTYLFIEAEEKFALLWAFLTVGAMVLLFRQILPNLIAHRDPEKRLVQLLPILKGFQWVTRPLALAVLSSLKLARRAEPAGNGVESPEPSEQEIQAYLDVGEEEGILEENDSELIQSVVEFGDTLVKEVMTPRTDIVALPETATVRELRDLMVRERHSRVPLYRDQFEHIVGMVHVRHILGHCEEGKFNTPVSRFLLPLPYIPETKKVGELLKELQSSGAHMAAVVDEFGGLAGLVTMEDLLEVIVGDIRDEDEPLEEEIRPEADGGYWLSGEASLDRLQKVLGVEARAENCSTISGLLIQKLGRVPASGDTFPFRKYQVEILHSDGRRILDLRLVPADQATSRPA